MADTQLVVGGQSLMDNVEVAAPPVVQTGQTVRDGMGFFEGLSEGASNEWLINNIGTGVDDDDYVRDPNWKNPVLSDPTVPLGYRTNFASARNQEHYDAIRAQLDEEMDVHRRLQDSSAWGVAGYMLAGFLDPTLLLAMPVEEFAIGSKALQMGKLARVLKSGAVYGASNALTEAGLAANKETRGVEDIALAGAAGFALQPLVEGAKGAYRAFRGLDPEITKYVSRVVDDVEGPMTPNPLPRNDEVRVFDTVEETVPALKKVGPVDKPDSGTFAGNVDLMAEADRRTQRNIARGGAKATEFSMGERLRANRNGIVATIADRLLEFPPGTGGKQVTHATADIRNTLFQNMIGSTYAGYDNVYTQWYKDMGYTMWNARIAGKGREEFGEAIMRELDARRMGITTNPHPAVKQAADEIVPAYNKITLDIQKKAGVLNADKVDHDPFYYHRQWDYEKMFNAGKPKVTALIAKAVKGAYLGMPDADAKKIANAFWRRFHDNYTSNSGAASHGFNADTRDTFQDYLMDILDEDTVQEVMNKITPVRGTEKAPGQLHRRIELDITATLDDGTSIYNLIETDYGMLLSRQSRDVSGRAALAEIGIKSDQDWDQLMRLARDYMGDDPKLKKDTEKGIRDLEVAKRRLLGQSTVPNPNSTWSRTARDLRDLTHLSRMGQMGLAQATELSNLLAEQGIPNILKAVPQMKRLTKMVKDGTMPTELAEDLAALGWRVGDDHLINIPYYRADDGGLKVTAYGDTPGTARWRNALQEGKRAIGYASLQNSVMRAEQKLWMHSTLARFYEDATGGAQIRPNRLRDMGFDDAMVSRIRDNIKRHGGKFEDQGIVTLGLDKWDPEVLDAFRTGLTRQNAQAIQQNTVGDLPAWAINSMSGQLLMQFRSFPLVAWSKQMKRQARHMDAVSFGTLAYGVPVCAAVHLARTHLNALGLPAEERKAMLDAQLSPKGMALGVVRYLPVASLMPDAAAATAPLLGLDFSSPYRGGTARAAEMSIGSIAPSLGYLNDAIKGVSALTNPQHEVGPKDVRRMLGILPIANAFGVKNAINGISSAFEE